MNVHKMSIAEKVGQLFMVSFEGSKPAGEVINLISTYKVGGLCYVTDNYRNPRQLHRLSTDLQHYANKDLPLLLSVNQGGGEFNSITRGVIQGPDQSTLGIINNRLYTKQMSEMIAEELHALGINMNFSPSLYISKGRKDSFGDSIDLVAKHGVASIQGYQKKNVSAVAKYFLENENRPIDTLLTEAYDMSHSTLYPYFLAIQKNVDAILLSSSFENEGRSIIQSLLRETLDFEGVLMKEVSDEKTSNTIAENAVKSIHSGVDLVLLSLPYRTQIAVIDKVIDAVKKGDIPENRLNEAVERILTLKEKRKVGLIKPFDRDVFEKKRAVQFIEKLQNLAGSRI
ncbi:glycoside hydrolase family 3 N-terminal domain-containing protein [Pseudogracilibacillus sp. SO30301A]|uniref:glycoside hydrolase family 3 N-terminal domain-containing protein n=1 Tax=Pseudogracilibacillus sp. SO30301A TaxID=3098291 RepID=UPI00300E2C66